MNGPVILLADGTYAGCYAHLEQLHALRLQAWSGSLAAARRRARRIARGNGGRPVKVRF